MGFGMQVAKTPIYPAVIGRFPLFVVLSQSTNVTDRRTDVVHVAY